MAAEVYICHPPTPGHDLRDWINELQSQGKSKEEIYAAIRGEVKPAGPVVEVAKAEKEKQSESELDQQDERLREILKTLGLIVLTKDPRGKIMVYSKLLNQRQEIGDVGRLSYPRLISIAGGRIVRKHVQEGSEDSRKYTLRDVRQAIGDAAGPKNEKSIEFRGSGIWKSKNELVICDQSCCAVWNGRFSVRETPIYEGYFYESKLASWFDSDSFRSLNPDPQETVQECIDLVARWRWDCSDAPEAVTGLILATWLQMIWSWRPQVVITGKKGSGKSIFFQMLESIFGELGDNQSDSTLSGIVSSIENSGIIILLDELDSNPERQKIFRLIKRAGRGAKRRTGTANQKSIETTAKQMFWCAGIDSGLQSDTEAERFVKLELLPKLPGSPRIDEPSESLCNDLGQRLLKLAVMHGRKAAHTALRLAGESLPPMPDRIVETYSVPAAMLAEVTGHPGREILVRLLENEATKKSDSQSDEDALREAVLGAHVQVGQGVGTLSVGQCVDRVIEELRKRVTLSDPDPWADPEDQFVAALEKVGVEITIEFFRIRHTVAARHLLQKTQFKSRSVKEIFLRMGFREKRLPGKRFLEIPLDYFLSES